MIEGFETSREEIDKRTSASTTLRKASYQEGKIMTLDIHIPDYIVYDELKRKRERARKRDEVRPQMEVPRYLPYLSEDDVEDAEEQEQERGEVIIQMW
ncbi:MAG: hypothetical protein AAGI01_07865 [Myxococcota bacterium]